MAGDCGDVRYTVQVTGRTVATILEALGGYARAHPDQDRFAEAAGAVRRWGAAEPAGEECEVWHVARDARFDDAAFYPPGPVVSVYVADRWVTVAGAGDPVLVGPGRVCRGWREFRAVFPDGQLPCGPDGGWVWESRGWFTVTAAGADPGRRVASLGAALDAAREVAVAVGG